MRTFDVLLSEKVYTIQGQMTEQRAKVIMHVFHGSWMLKEVRYNTECNIYSRSDWRFLKDLAIYVEYLCVETGADKLNISLPKEIDYHSFKE